MDEDSLVDWLRRRNAALGGSLIGDDAATLAEAEPWAITMDTQIEGVHFHYGLDPAHVARRLLAVNLSDLAATGAQPTYAFLALAAPQGFDHRRFFRALLAHCYPLGLELAGGDLARAPQLVATLTLLGKKPAQNMWLRRHDAKPNHRLWLGGTVGEAALGLKLLERGAHLEGRRIVLPDSLSLRPSMVRAARRAVRRHLLPRPQLELGHWLGKGPGGGVIDLSDGLAKDLHRLARASAVGAELELNSLPLAQGFRKLSAHLNLDWCQLALGGGEDYVLLFSLPSDLEPPGQFSCRAVGRIVSGSKISLLTNGQRKPLQALGWDHLARP
jgi:thiamine-monophosphate kinase